MDNSFLYAVKCFFWLLLVVAFFIPLILFSALLGVIQEWIDDFIDWVIWRNL